jgi:hypothetical protein
MKLSFPSRLVVACIALFSMLFMQLAMASYTCPGMEVGSESASASMPGMEMAGCEGMDMQQPTLCHTHAFGEATKQSLDKADIPQVQPFIPVGFVLALPAVDAAIGTTAAPTHTSILLTRTTAPPIAIRHCCFRI